MPKANVLRATYCEMRLSSGHVRDASTHNAFVANEGVPRPYYSARRAGYPEIAVANNERRNRMIPACEVIFS